MDYIMATDWLYGGGPASAPTSPSDSNSSTVTTGGPQDVNGNKDQHTVANKQEVNSLKFSQLKIY